MDERLEVCDAEFLAGVDARRANRMRAIDAMPAALRALVHEYGYAVVKTLRDVGVEKPKHIRHVVETVLNEFSPTRGAFSSQGTRNNHNPPMSENGDG